MADYSDAYRNYDYAEPARTSRVKRKTTKTTVFDFGTGPYTVEDFLDWAKELAALPTGAKVQPQYYDHQIDGQSLKFTIVEGS